MNTRSALSVVRTVIAVAALLSSSPFAAAAVIAADDFSYTLGSLNGTNGGSGWGSAWRAVSGASIVDPALDLSGNRALAISANNNNLAWRSLASSYSGNEMYVSMRMQLGSGTLNTNDFASLWFDSVATGGHGTKPQIGIKGNINGSNDIFARTTGSAGSFASSSNVIAGQTFLVIGKLSKVASLNYNHIDLWFNPSASDFATPDASFNGNSGLSSLTLLGLRSANLDKGDTVLIDDLRLATSWVDVSPVPEPSSMILSALGMCVIMGYRRRRQD